MLGEIKKNIEGDEETKPGLAKFSATRWTVRASCLERIHSNYQELQDTWAEVLAEGGLSSELKGRIVGVQAQMETFEYFFGNRLGYLLFRHTDNLAIALQGKRLCATEGHQIARQTLTVLKELRSDTRFDEFWQSVLIKKDLLPDIGK